MTLKLKRGERCPIHSSYVCCGRETLNRTGTKSWRRAKTIDFNSRQSRAKKDWKLVAPGVWHIPTEHHPRGYRVRRSKAAMHTLLKKKIEEQHGLCGICGEPFTEISGIVPDHIEPRGMGGANRDDHPDNIQAAHNLCNLEKGSQREFKKRGAGQ